MKIDRILAAFSTTPWAIQEEKLQAIVEFLDLRAERHLTEEEIQARIGEHVHAAAGRDLRLAGGGVAVLPLMGVISHRIGSVSRISGPGGTSTEAFGQSFRAALDNPDVGTIVLDVDSPGGSVYGVAELAREIYNARGQKRIVAVANALAASAAYWLATAADEVVVTPSGKVGSIGVFSVHRDLSRAEERQGVKTTIVRAGRRKAEGNPHEPLSEEALAALQEEVDDYYTAFVQAVALHRDVSATEVRTGFAEGATVRAERALALGMVDRIATLDEVLARLGVQTRRSNTTVAALPGEAAASIPSPEPASEARESTVEHNTAAQNGAGNHGDGAPVAIVGEDAGAKERKRVSEIFALCREHNCAARAESFIEAGMTAAQVGRVIQAEAAPAPTTTPRNLDISPKERRTYSLARALLAMDPESRHVDAGYEREVSQELGRILGRKPRGLLVSTRLGVGPQAAGLDSATSTTGAEVVYTEPGSFIELLRHRAMVARLGATLFPGLQGDVSFPRQNGAGTASWVAENPGSDVSDSNLTLDTVTLTPKTLQSTTSYSRQLLAQANIDVEALVRADLAAIHALAVDLGAINGSGSSNQPTGILNTSGIGAVAIGTNGGAPTFAHIVDLETQVTQDDADIGAMAYLTTSVMRGKLKKTEQFSSTNGMPVWTGGVENGEMNGYKAAASNQVPSTLTKGSSSDCHAILFGVWSQLLIGEWGAFDVIVDPYRLKKQNMIEVTSFQLIDIAVRHAQAFASIEDARNV